MKQFVLSQLMVTFFFWREFLGNEYPFFFKVLLSFKCLHILVIICLLPAVVGPVADVMQGKRFICSMVFWIRQWGELIIVFFSDFLSV